MLKDVDHIKLMEEMDGLMNQINQGRDKIEPNKTESVQDFMIRLVDRVIHLPNKK